MDKVTRSKFCVLIQNAKPFVGGWKIDRKGAWLRSRDQFRNCM